MRHSATSVVLALAVLAACSPLAPAKTRTTARPSVTASASLPALRFTGHGSARQPVRMVQQKGNRRQYQLLARSYESQGSSGSAHATLHDVHVTFYGVDGSSLMANAPNAYVDQAKKTVTLLGGVHATSSSGMTLTCTTLTYSAQDESIHGVGNVVARGPNGLDATGNRIDSNIALTHTRMQ